MRASLWLLLSLFVTAISWIYVTTVAAPWEHYVNVERGPMKAQMGDLYPSWYGTRELLYRGRNPYGPEVSDEIQMAYYGRASSTKSTISPESLLSTSSASPTPCTSCFFWLPLCS